MAAISISMLATFFNVEPKSINRGENYSTTIPNMLSFLNILKDVVKGSVRGQNQPKDSCCLDSPSQCRELLVSAKERKKLWETIHQFPFFKRTGSLIDHDCGDNKNKKQYI